MRYAASPTRPAIAAIAAVLAFQTLPAFAQAMDPVAPVGDQAPVAAPTVVAPPVVTPTPSAPVTASPVSPQVIYRSNGPVVQPIAAPTAPTEVAAPSAVQSVPRKATTSPTSPRKAVDVKNTASPVITAPTAVPVEQSPVDAGMVQSAPGDAPLAQPTPSPVTQVAAQPNDGTETGYWILGIGAVLLLGAGSYTAFRRKPEGSAPETMVGYKPLVGQERQAQPFVAVNPADRFKSDEQGPIAAPHTPEMEQFVASDMVAPVASARPAAVSTYDATGDLGSRREAMIAEPPSAANPFLTRKNRLRRANFLLARSADELLLDKAESPSVEAPVAAEKPANTLQVSYAFGKGSLHPPVLKPRHN